MKTVLGIPLYSRAFNNTSGLGEPFSGSRTYDIRNLPLSGCTKTNNDVTGSSYCYRNRELISYNTLFVLSQKADFIHNKTLGGAMFWETSIDNTGDQSIV
jgi:chitinase